MSTTPDFIEFVNEQLRMFPNRRYRKMFGEYIFYINDKPVLLICDNTVYVKILPEIADLMQNATKKLPYEGTKEHYVLDIEDTELSAKVITILESITPLPKPRKRTKNSPSANAKGDA